MGPNNRNSVDIPVSGTLQIRTLNHATEVIEVWFADDLSLGERQLDEGEFLDVFSATQQELEDWMRDGLLTDAKTVVGMMWLLQWRAGRWPLQWQTV